MSIFSKVLMRIRGGRGEPDRQQITLPVLRPEFEGLMFSGLAIQKLLDEYEFDTVLDLGSGEGLHSDAFMRHGKAVTAIDFGRSVYFQKRQGTPGLETIVADFNDLVIERQFDCVWCSHVLEHQLNPHLFLRKVHGATREGGVLAVTVPPLKHEIVGGHVSLWNAGLVLYHLVLAGFDCSAARVLGYGYNISVIVRKRSVSVLPGVAFDAGDIRKIRGSLPAQLAYRSNDVDDPFCGDIPELNWISREPSAGGDRGRHP